MYCLLSLLYSKIGHGFIGNFTVTDLVHSALSPQPLWRQSNDRGRRFYYFLCLQFPFFLPSPSHFTFQLEYAFEFIFELFPRSFYNFAFAVHAM